MFAHTVLLIVLIITCHHIHMARLVHNAERLFGLHWCPMKEAFAGYTRAYMYKHDRIVNRS